MNLSDIIRADAHALRSVTIHVVSIRGTVAIGDVIFLQGDEGSAFISEANRLWRELGDVSHSEVWAHLARPYVDCLGLSAP